MRPSIGLIAIAAASLAACSGAAEPDVSLGDPERIIDAEVGLPEGYSLPFGTLQCAIVPAIGKEVSPEKPYGVVVRAVSDGRLEPDVLHGYFEVDLDGARGRVGVRSGTGEPPTLRGDRWGPVLLNWSEQVGSARDPASWLWLSSPPSDCALTFVETEPA